MKRRLRSPHVLTIALATVTGCATPRASTASAVAQAPAAPASGPAPAAPRSEDVPRVVRRLVDEARSLIAQCLAMADELPDLAGRRRAAAEARDLAAELERITAPLGAPSPTSDLLDEAMQALPLLDSRVTLLHESLRIATERTTAVLAE